MHHEAARDWLETIEEPASIQFCRATQRIRLSELLPC
jgi:hypothetical protein